MSKFVKTFIFILVVAVAVIYFAARGFTSFNTNKPQEKVSEPPVITYVAPTDSFWPIVSNISNQIKTVATNAGSTETKTYKTISYTYKGVSTQQKISGYAIPNGYTYSQISPFFQKIRISEVYSSAYSVYPSQIKLASYFTQKSQRIDITGWKIKSNKNEIIIPQAVNLYDLLGYAVDSDIILEPNSYVNIYSNTSAVNKNLRLNKCMGYLENDFAFMPSLERGCPAISRASIAYLSGTCQSYILSLNSCQIPSIATYNSFPGGDDGNKCRAFLSNLNYTSCVKEHRNDIDFYLNDWRVWANRQILDPQHDTVSLFDSTGLLVDQYIY